VILLSIPPDPTSVPRNLHLFAGLVPHELREAVRFLDTRYYRPGEFIFEMGEPPQRLYFLERGIVKITIVTPDGRERILDVVDAGSTFGETFLSRGKRWTAAAQALSAATVRTIALKAFTNLMQTLPNLCLTFVRHLAELQHRTLVRLDAQMQMDRGLRLLAVLLDLGGRCGQRTDDNYTLPGELTQGELARMVGLNRSTVSVLLNYYRRNGILGGQGGMIVIHSTPARAVLRKAGLLLS
jgi:CRP/FNR family transcriptional regulator, cyclic AMP receptor protein